MDFAPLMGPEKYGVNPSAPASNSPSALRAVPTASEHGQSAASLLSLDNPLVAFGLVAALTFGAMAFSTSVRVGKTTAALSIGDT